MLARHQPVLPTDLLISFIIYSCFMRKTAYNAGIIENSMLAYYMTIKVL